MALLNRIAPLFLLAPAAFGGKQAPRGTLFLVGGGVQPPELVQQFVALAGGEGEGGGRGHARIIVIAMASPNGERSGEAKANELRALGADARNLWVTREQANTDSVAHLLDGATGVWLGGGDPSRLLRILRGSRTEAAIHARYEAGAVIGGTSAGAAAMAAVVITGDERHTGVDFTTIARNTVVTDSGFGLLSKAIVDQHFLRRKRHNRLLSLVLEREPHLGVGIDESTALIVHPDGLWSVAGASVVVIYDARSSELTPADAPVLGGTGIRMHVLPAGSSFDPKRRMAVLKP